MLLEEAHHLLPHADLSTGSRPHCSPVATCGNPGKLETENGVRILGHCGIRSKPAEPGLMQCRVPSSFGYQHRNTLLGFVFHPQTLQ